MKNKSFLFFIIVFLGSIVAMLFADFILLFFRDPSTELSGILVRLAVSSAGFVAAASLLLGRNARFFSPKAFQGEKENYAKTLKTLGALPIRMFAFFFLLLLLYLGALLLQGEAVGITQELLGPLYLAVFSCGLFVGAFIYVLSDTLVCRTLMDRNLTEYPRELRENRQSLKIFICPVAVGLIYLLFGISVTYLGINKAGGNISDLTGGFTAALVGIFVFFCICLVSLSYTLKMNASRLYKSVIAQLENLSAAEKDLTRRISISSVDELGTIAGMVNSFCENIAGGMRELKDGQIRLSDSGLKLGENSSTMAASLVQISTAVEGVRQKTERQMQSVAESSSAVQQIAKNIESLDKLIGDQASGVTEASASIEEMVGNITSIGNAVGKMTEHFAVLNETARQGSGIQQESGKQIAEIVTRSEALQEANKIISSIAAQTNLLAMNAAIEAAHAGEAGRGFSVVADEIRKLAETSGDESKAISNELTQVLNSIDQVVKSSGASERAFGQVTQRIDETQNLVLELKNAIAEQKEGSGQVLEALRLINDITAQVRVGSQEMSEGNVTVVHEMDRLQTDARDISGQMDEMAQGIGDINGSAQEVSQLAVSTRGTIDIMSQIVGGFKV